MLPEAGSCAASSGCSLRRGTLLPCPGMRLGHPGKHPAAPAALRGENCGHSCGRAAGAGQAGAIPVEPVISCRRARSAGHPGSRSCLPPAGRALSTGRDSPQEGPRREPLLPARLCPPASHPGRSLGSAPASPSLTRSRSTQSAVPAGGEQGQSGPAAYIKALYKGGTPGRGQGPTRRHCLRPPAGGSTSPARPGARSRAGKKNCN